MGLNQEVKTIRENYKSEFVTAWGAPDKKSAVAIAWTNLCNAVLAKTAMAESAGRMGHKELLLGIVNECARGSNELTTNPDDWNDREILICHRRLLHLMLSINPYGAMQGDWQPEM